LTSRVRCSTRASNASSWSCLLSTTPFWWCSVGLGWSPIFAVAMIDRKCWKFERNEMAVKNDDW